MRLQEHISKLSWTAADKLVFVLYGLVNLFQIKAMNINEFGLFILLINLNTWFFILSDSFALQCIIQYGGHEQNRRKVNLISLLFHIFLTLGLSLVFFAIKHPISNMFDEPRLVDVSNYLPALSLLTLPRTYCLKILYRDIRLKEVFLSNLSYFGTMALLTVVILSTRNYLSFEDMILIYFAGTAISSAYTTIAARKRLVFGRKGEVGLKKILSFGGPSSLIAALHSLPGKLDVFIIKLFFPLSTVGLYSTAKTLYRIFEEAGNASYGLVYPPAVKMVARNDYEGLKSLYTKSSSFMLVFFAFSIIILELGLSDYFILSFLPYKFHPATGLFDLLIIAALFIPFFMLSFILFATGKQNLELLFVFISSVVSLATFVVVGYLGYQSLMPLGVIVYNFILGMLNFYYIKKHYGFPITMALRAFGDTYYFIKAYLLRKNIIKIK